MSIARRFFFFFFWEIDLVNERITKGGLILIVGLRWDGRDVVLGLK